MGRVAAAVAGLCAWLFSPATVLPLAGFVLVPLSAGKLAGLWWGVLAIGVQSWLIFVFSIRVPRSK